MRFPPEVPVPYDIPPATFDDMFQPERPGPGATPVPNAVGVMVKVLMKVICWVISEVTVDVLAVAKVSPAPELTVIVKGDGSCVCTTVVIAADIVAVGYTVSSIVFVTYESYLNGGLTPFNQLVVPSTSA